MTAPSIDLKALIAGIKQKQETERSLARAVAAVKGARSKAAEEEAAAALAALRDRIDWQPAAIVFRIERWVCTCGRTGEAGAGLFLLQEHVREAGSRRLLRCEPGEGEASLPRYRWVEPAAEVTLCPSCAPLQGYHKRYTPPARAAQSPATPGSFTAEWHLMRLQGLSAAPLSPETPDEANPDQAEA